MFVKKEILMNRVTYSKLLRLLLIVIFLCGFTPHAEKVPYCYKVANYELTDDYYWLRDKDWPDIKDQKILAYLQSENNYAENSLFAKYATEKEQIFQGLQARFNFAATSEYTKKDNYYYYTRTVADKNYKIHCRKQGGPAAKEEVLLDENLLAKDAKFMQVGSVSISDDHKYLAYAVDFVGNEIFTIKVLDLTTKEYLKDEIHNVSLSDSPTSILWHKNNAGFFYMPSSARLFPEKVMFHKLADNSKDDKLIYFEPDHEFSLVISQSQDKRFLFINSFAGCFNEIYLSINNVVGHSNEIHFLDLDSNLLEPKLVQARQDNLLYAIEHQGDNFFIRTNDVGGNYRLVKTSISNLGKENWQEVIPQAPEKYLETFDVSNNYLVLNYKVSGLPIIEVMELKTQKKNIITFPSQAYTAIGYVTNFSEDELKIYYSSLNEPATIYSYHFSSAKLAVIKTEVPLTNFHSADYVVERLWADNNGVQVPLSILYKKALFKHDGSNPLYLYGYGAYGSEVQQSFRAEMIPLVDQGFVFAIAHCRGGNELGDAWYAAGKLLNKRNTFADFIACTEALIQSKYTSASHIVISGRSAGGTLIGDVINERPELYKAAIMHEPFVDVLNTVLDESMPFTVTDFQEWGNPKSPGVINYIRSYSPYDNIKKQKYPNIFITTSTNDPRVGYWESAKFVAKLREYKTDHNELIFKVKMNAGHIGASGKMQHLKEVADDYIFMQQALGKLN